MAQRNISADKPIPIKAPGAPRAQERELGQMTAYMIEQISTRFRNQAIKSLQASTVDKFADAQMGNYARVFLRLANRTTRKMEKQFDNKRIDDRINKTLGKVNTRNRSELYGKVEKAIGLSTAELTSTEGLMADVNALNLETSQWVKKLRDETLEMYTANTLAAMSQGKSLPEILEQFDGLVEKRKNHAKFTARNQIGNFNSLTTKIRAQNLGITQAIWRTSRDERVRPCHKVRDGKTFDLDKGLYSSCDGLSLLPGVDFQCRCDYELIIPEDD